MLPVKPARPRAADWQTVSVRHGTVYDSHGRELRGARFARLERGKLRVMGPYRGTRFGANPRRDLHVYNPERRCWVGHMGGLNYEPPCDEAVGEALDEVWTDHPGAVILDGTDDWFAPEHVRPELFEDMFGIEVLALWHTGASGSSTSGIVLTEAEYETLNIRYRMENSYSLELVPSRKQKGSHSACGCWDGSAFVVHHDPRRLPGSWVR